MDPKVEVDCNPFYLSPQVFLYPKFDAYRSMKKKYNLSPTTSYVQLTPLNLCVVMGFPCYSPHFSITSQGESTLLPE